MISTLSFMIKALGNIQWRSKCSIWNITKCHSCLFYKNR